MEEEIVSKKTCAQEEVAAECGARHDGQKMVSQGKAKDENGWESVVRKVKGSR